MTTLRIIRTVKGKNKKKVNKAKPKTRRIISSSNECRDFLDKLFMEESSYERIREKAAEFKSRIEDYNLYGSFIKQYYNRARIHGFYNPQTQKMTGQNSTSSKGKGLGNKILKANNGKKHSSLSARLHEAITEERKKKPFFQWVKFISVPMGGQRR